MTSKEIQKRNAKAESLRVLQADDGSFYVESEKGKILYNVILDDEETSCTCGDFAKNSKKDSNFQCKHMLAVLNAIPKREIENARYCEKHVPKLDDRFMTNIKGKDFVLYAGVLDLATQKRLLKLEVELLQYPSKENGNEAICHAAAESATGQVFSDIGDANPANCHSMIAKHLIRMASTRAKGRALRDMCNIGTRGFWDEFNEFLPHAFGVKLIITENNGFSHRIGAFEVFPDPLGNELSAFGEDELAIEVRGVVLALLDRLAVLVYLAFFRCVAECIGVCDDTDDFIGGEESIFDALL